MDVALQNEKSEVNDTTENVYAPEMSTRCIQTLDSLLEGRRIIDRGWRYIYVNDAVARHGKKKKEELLGHTMQEVYPGIEKTAMFAGLERCMYDKVPCHIENEFTYPNGKRAWFELSVQSVPEGIFILSIDITRRKRSEEKTRGSDA